jgi:hypothetical protein
MSELVLLTCLQYLDYALFTFYSYVFLTPLNFIPLFVHLSICFATVSSIPGEAPEPLYQNYLMEGVLGTLQWIQNLLIAPAGISSTAPPLQDPAAVQNTIGQPQQMVDAATRLQALSEQMREVGRNRLCLDNHMTMFSRCYQVIPG